MFDYIVIKKSSPVLNDIKSNLKLSLVTLYSLWKLNILNASNDDLASSRCSELPFAKRACCSQEQLTAPKILSSEATYNQVM